VEHAIITGNNCPSSLTVLNEITDRAIISDNE